ncbi:MAG: hypothetical protein V9G10_17535 [Candidatus Nanopelagicales bacterium]
MSADRPKTGVFLQRYAINPVNGEQAARSTPRTTCWPTTARARSWLCLPTTSATWTSRGHSGCRSAWLLPPTTDPAVTGVATADDGPHVNSGPLGRLGQGRSAIEAVIAELAAEGTGRVRP